MLKQFAVLSFSVALSQGCAQPSAEQSAQIQQKLGPFMAANSSQAFGGEIAGTTIRGIFQGQTGMASSRSGYWVRSDSTDYYAPIDSITLNGESVSSLSAPEGIFLANTSSGLQIAQGESFILDFQIGAPLNAILRLSATDVDYSYGRYTAQWFAGNDDEGTWSPFCPHLYQQSDESWVNQTEYLIPVGGARWLVNGTRVNDSASIQLSCTHDSIGGCINWGYEPWAKPTGVSNMKDIHQACTRMKRADFCGTGDPLTTINQGAYLHTDIQIWDSAQIHTAGSQTWQTMEAFWGTNGATCVNSAEYRSDNPNYIGHKNDLLSGKSCMKQACAAGDTGLIASARPCLEIDADGVCIQN